VSIGLATLLAVGDAGTFGGDSHAATKATITLAPTGDDAACNRTSTTPCKTFQRAYSVAQPGDVVSVQAGDYPANDLKRNAVTIFGAAKSGTAPVTFTCASAAPVTFSAPWFTIKAFNVAITGHCFQLHAVRIGEPGDRSVTTRNVLIDGAHLDGLEVVGAQQVTLRNLEIGPNVACYAQGKTGKGKNGRGITSAMWCDPAASPFEAFYAQRGTDDLPLQPYFHNNAGGVNPTVVLENSYIHDIQTKDAFNLHTGCGLIWTRAGAAPNSIVFRNDRYVNCAVLGLLFDHADGVTVTGTWFGYPTEPLSNGKGPVEAPVAQREIVFKTSGSGAGWKPKNWLISFNSFTHGISLDNSNTHPPFTNVVVRRNLLGRNSYCPPGTTFQENLFEGRACGTDPLTVPFGYELESHRLVPNAKEAATVRAIFKHAAAGLKPPAVAKQLKAAHLGSMTALTIRHIVENELYMGSQLGPKGADPALVKRAVWKRAQKSLPPLS